ncbi:MAG: ACT domain-containing protein [Desulfovibrio sp.]|jgi:hypothetical protein|nr:ACT domain-containing protein [Desulfovibrio sp.]
MPVEQISVFVENHPGGLAVVAEALSAAGIDIRAMSLADTTDFGVLRLIVNDAPRTQTVLRAAGYIVSVTPVLAAFMEDRPGGLARVLQILADAAVNVEYLYAFITRKAGNALVILRVEDVDFAEKMLAKKGVQIADASTLLEL